MNLSFTNKLSYFTSKFGCFPLNRAFLYINSDDFEITDGWVTIKGGSIDLDDLPSLAQYQALARSTAGTGAPEAVSFTTIVENGGAIVDGDFAGEVAAVSDPGEALIKTGVGTYAYSNVLNLYFVSVISYGLIKYNSLLFYFY